MDTIASFLESSARKFPNKEALICEEKRLTYSELNSRAHHVRNFLLSHCKRQDVVSLLLGNSIEFLVTYFGILEAGCIAHIIPVNASDDNLVVQIQEVTPTYIFTTPHFKEKIARVGVSVDVIEVGSVPQISNEEVTPRTIHPQDISSIIYSSGTTSKPKGVKLQHKNVVQATENMIQFLGVKEDDVYLNVLPLAHSFGLGNVHMTICQGGTVIVERNTINIPLFLKRIVEEKATIFAAAPATYRIILDKCKDLFFQCQGLRMMITNSTAIPPETTQEILDAFPHTEFYTYYGLTEASRSTFMHFNTGRDKLTSVGQPSPSVAVKIVGDNGKVLKPFQHGEVAVQGNHVITEYWKNKEASEAIRSGWLHTGDYGYLDKRGYLFLVGRKDDIMNIGGEKVSPLEIEKVLAEVEGINQVAVIGTPDKILNEVVTACVVKGKGSEITEDDIFVYAKKHLSRYKVPKHVQFVATIPTTDSGKIKRKLLARMLETPKLS
jgi:long-chain acyl-CoA synthetase